MDNSNTSTSSTTTNEPKAQQVSDPTGVLSQIQSTTTEAPQGQPTGPINPHINQQSQQQATQVDTQQKQPISQDLSQINAQPLADIQPQNPSQPIPPENATPNLEDSIEATSDTIVDISGLPKSSDLKSKPKIENTALAQTQPTAGPVNTSQSTAGSNTDNVLDNTEPKTKDFTPVDTSDLPTATEAKESKPQVEEGKNKKEATEKEALSTRKVILILSGSLVIGVIVGGGLALLLGLGS